MDSTHTPGPWAWGNWIDGKQGAKDSAGWVEVWAPQGDDKGLPFIACKHQNEIANARLVAAAPDLLEALIAIRRAELEDTAGTELDIIALRAKADAAIAKATADPLPPE